MKRVEREPYSGPVADTSAQVDETQSFQHKKPEQNGSNGVLEDGFTRRINTSGGGRNMQESSFAFSGQYSWNPG